MTTTTKTVSSIPAPVVRTILFVLAPSMRAMDYEGVYELDRKYVSQMFERLESLGYGTYTPATKGKGCCAKFAGNSKMPATFEMEFTIEQKRPYTKKSELWAVNANGTTGI